MASKLCVIVLAVAVFGNVAFGTPRYRRSGITVVSGVDQNGQEYGGIFRNPDGQPGLFNRFGDEDNEAIPPIPDFVQNLSAPPNFGVTLNNYINLLFKMFREQFQNNLALQEQTNRIAIDAANTISNRVGFPFQYTPPGPDFAYASGQIGPQDTYVKTEINDPNRDRFIFDRFQDDDSEDETKQKSPDSKIKNDNSKDKDNSKEPSSSTSKDVETTTSTTDASTTTSTTKKPQTITKQRPVLPKFSVLTNNKVVPGDTSLNNRFSEDENADIKTIVSSTADGKTVYRTTVITKKGDDPSLGNRFSDDGDDTKLESVQTFLTSDADGKPIYETTVYTSKAEPSLNSRFSDSDDENSQKDNSIRTFVTSLGENSNTKVDDDGTHAEIITNKNGTIRRIVTKNI